MASTTPDTASSITVMDVNAKIMADLDTVVEKMDLCTSMLRPTDGGPSASVGDSTLLSVIGFLEACAPRMIELVEAAAQGALNEQVLMRCLEVNDRLTKMLEDVDTAALTETPASTTAAAAPKSVPEQLQEDLDKADGDLLGLSLSEEDTKPSAIAANKSEDEFDSFFNERQGGN